MARPSNATVFTFTPKGIPFQWLTDDIKSKGARDASMAVVLALVAEPDAEDFLAEAVGYTTWDGSAPTFDRTLPLACPLPERSGLWCEDYDRVDYGAYESRDDFNLPPDNTPVQDWHIYALTFTRPRWWVRSNFTLAALFGNKEQQRFTTTSEMPRPRERIVSGFGYEYLRPGGDATVDADWLVVPEERQFIPDYQIDIVVTWLQIPIAAPPYGAILSCANTVNSNPIQFTSTGRIWPPESLLFKGLAKPIEMYFGADDNPYYDLSYRFTVQPGGGAGGIANGGWNKYLSRDGAGAKLYLPVRERGSKKPPYPATEFQALFTPVAP